MAELILIRHGQANSLATDEASYDRLSDLGRTQATWLGEHLAQTNPHFDRVITGTLSRQIETARAMGYQEIEQDARLNELSYWALAQAAEVEHGLPMPQSPADYVAHLPQMMQLWSEGGLASAPEPFEAFSARVEDAIDQQCAASGRAMLVTSGGVIGIVISKALGLNIAGTSKVMLQIANASMHRMQFIHDTLLLSGFNATPHLDLPDRAYARTHV